MKTLQKSTILLLNFFILLGVITFTSCKKEIAETKIEIPANKHFQYTYNNKLYTPTDFYAEIDTSYNGKLNVVLVAYGENSEDDNEIPMLTMNVSEFTEIGKHSTENEWVGATFQITYFDYLMAGFIHEGTSGSITITELTSQYVKGTFEFKVEDLNDNSLSSIQNGSFYCDFTNDN